MVSERLFPQLVVDPTVMDAARACLRAESERATKERGVQEALTQAQIAAAQADPSSVKIADPATEAIVRDFPFLRAAANDQHEGKKSDIVKVRANTPAKPYSASPPRNASSARSPLSILTTSSL